MLTFSKKLNKDLICLVALILISASLLFYRLGRLPDKAHLDEVRLGYMAASLENSHYLPYYAKSDGYSDNHPTFGLYQMLLSFNTLGVNIFSLRLIPVIYGILTVGIFYLLLRQFFVSKWAFLGSLILLFSYKYIALTRWFAEIPIYLFFLVLSFFILIKYFKSLQIKVNDLKLLFFLGVSLGLMQHTYGSARVFLIIIPLCLIYLWLSQKLDLKKIGQSLAVFSLGLFITLYPLLVAYKNLPGGTFDNRGFELPILRSDVPLSDKVWAFRHATIRTLGMFHLEGSSSECYSYKGSKFLDPLSGILLIIGLIYSFLGLNKSLSLLTFTFFISTMVPSFLSVVSAAPQESRASGAVIFSVFYVMLAIKKILEKIKDKYLKFLIIFAIFSFIVIYNLQSYFLGQMTVKDSCFLFSNEHFKELVRNYVNLRPLPFTVFNPFF